MNKIEIKIDRELTRAERMLLLLQAIEKTEEYGHGYVLVKIHGHQITDMERLEGDRFGNCDQAWYDTN